MFGFGKKNDNVTQSVGGIDLTKKTEALNLRKETLTISLKKKNIDGIVARVVFVMDRSGSMRDMYKDGTVQETTERILPLALKFDDDGELDSYLFQTGFNKLPAVTINNYFDYQEKVMDKYGYGGTEYAPVIEDIVKKYKNYNDVPTYVLFFTDGDNSDKRATTEIIKEASKYPIFWQFVGIGNASMEYLERLDDLTGRAVDNVDFFKVVELSKISDSELYDKLLNEFPGWLQTVKQMGYLK